MIARFWLINLPSTDAAFDQLHHAAEINPDEFADLARGHRMAVLEAAFGRSLVRLEVKARALHKAAERVGKRAAQLEAMGYALGVTAVRVAIRERHEAAELGVAS